MIMKSKNKYNDISAQTRNVNNLYSKNSYESLVAAKLNYKWTEIWATKTGGKEQIGLPIF